jgi:hypothetical protein
MGVVAAQRTLVKSVPELWAQLTDAGQLGSLLDPPFGEIAITRVEPESRIEWAGAVASGSVEIEPSVFGARVSLVAELTQAAAPAPRRRRLLDRLLRRPGEPEIPPPSVLAPDDAERALTALLDEVGAPRHRPFSRYDRTPPPIA